ncbi:MAG: DUF4838 domain-containing protein [Thermoguttaceae bacterium]|nr:DUF4838 domain-containing protein [Thermoguttaceae bacterium]MDW8080047.1 DUF4838 domain-containing protein [Thermoguttaceae bacterium]
MIPALFGSIVLVFGLSTGELSPQETPIARAGKAACRIIVHADVAPAEAELAAELAKWLAQIVGDSFPVERGAVGPGIILGLWTKWAGLAPRELAPPAGPEAYRLFSDGQRVWILANEPLGLKHGVYGFLHQLGCRWFFPDPVWTVIPRQADLVVKVDVSTAPAFAYRRIWYGWGPRTKKLAEDYDAWLRHNRQLGFFIVDCGHAYERYIPESEFKDHPEWFSLVKGKRQPLQLCVSNKEVQERVIAGVLELFRRNPERIMASVEPNDGPGYCECENCRAIGSPSDQVFFLANTVGKALRQAYPDKWVGLYAYAGHSDPPRFPLEPNVYVKVTTGFRYTKLSFEEQVARFRQLGSRVGVYDYFSVYPWDWDLPGVAKAGRPRELAAAIKHYAQLGLFTYDAESSCNWGPNGPGYWLAAQLMWDPSIEAGCLLDEFCQKAFGPAASPMRRLYERWWRGERFSGRNLKLALLDLREAYELVDDSAIRARLDRMAMYLHWLRLWWEYDRSSRSNQWGRLVTASGEDILAKAKAVLSYTRRIMDTGVVHSYPALYSEWLRRRFGALAKLPEFDWAIVNEWIRDETIPSPEEVWRDFQEDLRAVEPIRAAEIKGVTFVGPVVPVVERAPQLVEMWGKLPETQMAVESGLFFFRGKAEEDLVLGYRPHDSGHTVDCQWQLFRANWPEKLVPVLSGHIQAERGQSAEAALRLPEDGVFAFDPGTGYWKAAVIGFDRRPLSLWAGRPFGEVTGRWPALCLWLPHLGQRLYFYVPRSCRHFVLGVVSGGDPYTHVKITNAAGEVLVDEKILAGDQLTVFLPGKVEDVQSASGSGVGANEAAPAQQRRAQVGGQILALELTSLRCQLELYDIPPFVARHPAELLVPADALED